MGTETARSVLARVSILLSDADKTRWPQDEQLLWLSDGQREAVIYKPNAYVRSVAFELAKGSKQQLPGDCHSLVDMPYNTDGDSISVIPRAALDQQMPGWLRQPASRTVVHYCYSELDSKHAYVYPPAAGGHTVELIYNAIPPNVGIDAPIALDDIYVGPLVDYVLFRCFSKDAEDAPPGSKSATQHYQNFLNAIRGKASGESATDPNKRDISNPNTN